MRVIRSEVMGMCFGVRDALDMIDDVGQPEEVTIHGELVHNETVLRELDARGFRHTPENRRNGIPTTPKVLITAHGISHTQRRRLRDAGVELLDTTCPLVRKVHDAGSPSPGATATSWWSASPAMWRCGASSKTWRATM